MVEPTFWLSAGCGLLVAPSSKTKYKFDVTHIAIAGRSSAFQRKAADATMVWRRHGAANEQRVRLPVFLERQSRTWCVRVRSLVTPVIIFFLFLSHQWLLQQLCCCCCCCLSCLCLTRNLNRQPQPRILGEMLSVKIGGAYFPATADANGNWEIEANRASVRHTNHTLDTHTHRRGSGFFVVTLACCPSYRTVHTVTQLPCYCLLLPASILVGCSIVPYRF